MKTISYDMRYDGRSTAEVFAMLQTPAFREEVCNYQGYTRHSVSITPNGEGMDVVIDQYREASEIPSFARKFAGSEINIVQRETWTSPTEADLVVEIPGKPGTMTGTVRMKDVDGGTIETVTVNLKVSIPLVGGKLEDFLGTMLLKALKAENKVGVKWFAEH